MNIILENSFSKVWVDATIPCIFTRLGRPLMAEETEILSKNIGDAIKKLRISNHPLYSVTNLEGCTEMSVENIENIMTKIVAREFKYGITHKYFIRPKDVRSKNALFQVLLANPNTRISVHSSFHDSLAEIGRVKEENSNAADIDEQQKNSSFLNNLKALFQRTVIFSK